MTTTNPDTPAIDTANLPPQYTPADVEPAMRARWDDAKAWHAEPHADAQERLGHMLLEGVGTEADPAGASEWLMKASERGSVPAQLALAKLYDEGGAIDRNEAESFRWYRAAADQGSPDGLYAVGFAYANGKGVAQDPREALRWYLQAADSGHAGALLGMRMLFAGEQLKT